MEANCRRDPAATSATFVQVVAANGRCVVRPTLKAPKSAQEIELERFLLGHQSAKPM